MKQLDPELQESIAKRFGLASNEQFEVVTKEGVATLSTNITKLTNALNAVKAYEQNITEINKVVAKSSNIEARETQLETTAARAIPQSAAGGSLFSDSDLKQLTKGFELLAKTVKQRNEAQVEGGSGSGLTSNNSMPDLGDVSGGDRDNRRGRGSRAMRLAGRASVAGIATGIVGNLASDALSDAGYEKTAAGVDTAATTAGMAGTGALIGSVIPGIGTAAGAAVGGIAGLGMSAYQNWDTWFGGDEEEPEAEKEQRAPPKATVEKVLAEPVAASAPVPSPAIPKPPSEFKLAVGQTFKSPQQEQEKISSAALQSIQPAPKTSEYTEKMNQFVGDSVKNVEKSKSLWERMFGKSDETRGSEQGGGVPSGGGGASDDGGGEESGEGSQNLPSSGSYDMKLAKLLADYEGIRTTAYKDSKGIPTIGIGATYYPKGFRLQGRVQMGQSISGEEAEWIKSKHVTEHRGRLLKEISSGEYGALPDGVKAALESKVFNYGNLGGPLAQLTKKAIQSKNFTLVSNYFRTTLAPHNRGLNAWRRNDEAKLIETGRSGRVSGLSFGTTPSPRSDGSAGAAPAPGGGGGGGGGGGTGGQGGGGGGDVANTDSIKTSIRGKKIWDYARKNGSDVDYDGLKQGMKDRFLAMAIEYNQRTGRKVAINSANRTYAKQAAIYKKYGPRRAAPPGRSKHESGVAIDINSPDAEKMIQLGLLKKYGFYRPYMPKETWHIEPVEASKVRGQSDNPYEPGAPIAQTGAGGKPVLQDDRGQTKPVESPKAQLGEPAAGAAIQTKMQECDCPTMVIPVNTRGGASQGPGPAQYLAGIKPSKQPTSQPRNPVEEYRFYFAA